MPAHSKGSIISSRRQSDSNVTIAKTIKKSTKQQRTNTGHWTPEEHDTYLEFLMAHRDITIQNQMNKKNNKIFKLMAQTIGTRSPSQCRSHHQKFNPFTEQGQQRLNRMKKTEVSEVKPNQTAEPQFDCQQTILEELEQEPKVEYEFPPFIQPLIEFDRIVANLPQQPEDFLENLFRCF